MKSLNQVQIIGNVTRDPEMKALQSGTSVATFGVATNRVWKNKDTGEKESKAEFHNCVAWSKLADIVGQYVKKGMPLYVKGYLQTQSWEDKETGKKMYRTEIVCDDIIMLGSKDDNHSGGEQSHPQEASQDAPLPTPPAPQYESEVKAEALPF